MRRALGRFSGHYAKFAVARTFSAFLALIFSVLYSRQLGTDSRGIVSALFLVTLILSEVILGAANLKIRTTHFTKLDVRGVSDFIVISLIASLLIGILTSCSLIAYSELKANIATPFLLISFLYSFITSCLVQLVNLQLSFGNFSLVWRIELACVTIQIAIFFCVSQADLFSTAINLITSISVSYVFVIFYVLINLGINYLKQLNLSINVRKNFSRLSSGNVIYVITTSILDRLDRIIVLILFSSALFAKYSVLTGLIMFLRFVPDIFAKIILAKRITHWTQSKQTSTLNLIGIVIVAIPIASIFVNFITQLILGPEWVLPKEVVFMVIFSEFLRAIFIVRINARLATLRDVKTHSNSSFSALIISAIVALISIFHRNLVIVPLAMVVGYSFSLILFNKFERRIETNPAAE